MKSNMKIRFALSMVSMLFLWVNVAHALPLAYTVDARTHKDVVGPGDLSGTYQPLAAKNLLAVISTSSDYADATVTESADAAVFGSDTSAVFCTVCEGKGIEPMAHAVAATVFHDSQAFSYNPLALGFGSMEVFHRTRLTDDAPSGDWILAIPLFLHYTLETSGGDGITTSAAFYIEAPGMPTFSKNAVNGQDFSGKLTLNSSAFDLIKIGVNAGVTARYVDVPCGDGCVVRQGVSGFAVADPFLFVDPDWEYAPYVVVEQESILHPGEWVEVTRAWAEPIPEPEAYAMMLAGLGLVITVVRRRKQV